MGRFCNNIGRSFKLRPGYKTLQDVIETNKLPVNVQIDRLDRSKHDLGNGIFTIHYKDESTILKCVAENNEDIYLDSNDCKSFSVVNIENEKCYETVESLRNEKREDDINWFVSTKTFDLEDVKINTGQIFCFASRSLRSLSFKRERGRKISVQLYPSMKKVFLPFDVNGNFRKCENPNESETDKLLENSISANRVPFIIISGNKKELETYFVKDKKVCPIVYASKKVKGTLEIHVFSVSPYAEVKVLNEVQKVDTLEEKEIEIVKDFAKTSDREKFNEFHKHITYSEIGITRLLAEIFSELNGKLSAVNTSKTSHGSQLKEINIVNCSSYTQKQVQAGNRHYMQSKALDKLSLSRAKRFQKLKASKQQESSLSPIYVNDSPLSDQTNPQQRELIVEFDDGGYVIIPFSGKAPKVKLDVDTVSNVSTENVAYNYQRISRISNLSEHIYTYINYDEMSSVLENAKDKEAIIRMSRVNFGNSVFYGYPHVTQFRLPADLSKQYIRQLNTTEVTELLEKNQFKHHAMKFQEKNIDGDKLTDIDRNLLKELNFTHFECEKLICFINGWRPLKTVTSEEAWLTNFVSEWSVYDVEKYLLHINMRSFRRFATCQNIDGYLLQYLVKDNKMFPSLKLEHGVNYGDKDIQRLKSDVYDDDKPKFRFCK